MFKIAEVLKVEAHEMGYDLRTAHGAGTVAVFAPIDAFRLIFAISLSYSLQKSSVIQKIYVSVSTLYICNDVFSIMVCRGANQIVDYIKPRSLSSCYHIALDIRIFISKHVLPS